MPPPQQHSRINLADLKAQIGKRLGPDRARQYFGYLNRFFSQKLSKSEFDKLCFIALGRENIPLHNQLIRSIIKNAHLAKDPPYSLHDKDAVKSIRAAGKISPSTGDGSQVPQSTMPMPPIWSNGDLLPPSPRKCRSGVQERRIRDRSSPLGPNGRIDVGPHHSLAPYEDSTVRENGTLAPCDLRRPVQQHQTGIAEQPTKRFQERVSVHSKGLNYVIGVEDGDEVEQIEDTSSSRGPVLAPLGIPFCSASVGGARKPLPASASSSSFLSNSCSGELCHTEVLKRRMEQIAEAHGLGCVTLDSANLLNKGLDAYLKQLINSCVHLVGARSGHEPIKHPAYKQQPHGKIINGMWPGNHMHIQSNNGSLQGSQVPKIQRPVSLLDFRVAMELNPQQLGEDWPLMLEKICLSSFEE